MGQILLESLSRRQLLLFVFMLFLFMVVFFVIGGTKGADPASANVHISNVYNKPHSFSNDSDWLWYKINGNNSYLYEDKLTNVEKETVQNPDDIVFSAKIPHPGGNMTMHRVHQFMLVIMNIQMEFQPLGNVKKAAKFDYKVDCAMTFNAKLAYSDVHYPTKPEHWTMFQRVMNQSRPLICVFSSYGGNSSEPRGYYMCQDQHFFELGSVTHKHYLINVQLPSEHEKNCLASYTNTPEGIHFVEIHQNGGYTISLFVSKTVMFPFIVAALLFFLRRIKREQRQWLLLEKGTFWLGIALSLLLLPIDWFTLVLDMPYMLFFSDLRQGFFYTTLLIFWCLFAGEHILDQEERNKLSSYKYEVGSITVGCFCLFLFDTVERGVQLANPFHTIWKRDAGEKVAKAFIALAAVAAIIYCLFFVRLLYYVRKNINIKSVALPAMQEDRRLFYENKIYRFRVLLYTTLFTVIVTVLCFVLDQINETSWKFQEDSLNEYVIVSSAMHFGVFGLWGTYVFAILVLYSPDAKSSSSLSGSTLNVQYRRSEHLLRGPNDDDEDDVQFAAPKSL